MGSTRATEAADGGVGSTSANEGSAGSTRAGRVGRDVDLDGAAIGPAVDATAAFLSIPRAS